MEDAGLNQSWLSSQEDGWSGREEIDTDKDTDMDIDT